MLCIFKFNIKKKIQNINLLNYGMFIEYFFEFT